MIADKMLMRYNDSAPSTRDSSWLVSALSGRSTGCLFYVRKLLGEVLWELMFVQKMMSMQERAQVQMVAPWRLLWSSRSKLRKTKLQIDNESSLVEAAIAPITQVACCAQQQSLIVHDRGMPKLPE